MAGKFIFLVLFVISVAGVMVSIAAFQAVDPGSIPGPRTFVSFKRGEIKKPDAGLEPATSRLRACHSTD